MWRIIVLSLFALAASQEATFDNYRVYRIFPTTTKQVEELRQLEKLSDGYDFWIEPSYIGRPVDVMVAPHKVPQFFNFVKNIGVAYETYIEDVQKLIDRQKPQSQTQKYSASFDFNTYHTLDEIYDYLHNLEKTHSGKVEVIVGGSTYEGRQIKGVKVSFGENNPGVFIEGGIHAREWITPATVMYILHQLLHSTNPDVREMAERHDWYIFPVFNPDGYVYTHTHYRLWRKSRKPYTSNCYGSDLNRNWDYKWMMNGGASSNPCEETYGGSAPFSDIESKSMSEFITSISDKLYAYISFHSYSQLLLFPYGHTRDHLDNHDELLAIGKKAIAALSRRYGTQYVTGNIAETIYIATGNSMDWVKGNYKLPITYTYELRDKGRHGFLLPPDQIIPTGEETLDSLVAIIQEAKARGHPK